nr:TylF/MycF/NovP-related O-methyltransferase [uncultured Rhodopila sp.]
MRWFERAVRDLAVGAINSSGALLLQQLPIALRNSRADFLALRRHWISGKPKGNDLDMVRLAFFATNIAALEAAGVPGAFAELGVWRGNSAKVIHSLAPGRELYLLDTFQGFPDEDCDADPIGGVSHHFQDVSVDKVCAFVGQSDRIHFVVGRFPDSAGAIPFDQRFAFVHIDCDLYQPVRAGLEYFHPRMSPQGLIVVHDYGSGRWPGVTRAVNEYLADKPETPVLIPDTSGTAVIVRQRILPA